MPAIVTLVFCVVLAASVLFIPPLPDQVQVEPLLLPTPTINYYQEDLYAQCAGLDSLNKLLEEHPSLRLNGNFRKEVQLRLEAIERDKGILGLDLFECPQKEG